MHQKNFIVIAAVIVLAGIGYYLWRSPAPQRAPAPAPAPAANRGAQTHNVSMNTEGFTANAKTPTDLTIRAGDSVVFTNDETRDRWPASAIHPTHLLCPGFDARDPVKSGESYSHTFTAAQECPFHDHLIPTLRGKITVTE